MNINNPIESSVNCNFKAYILIFIKNKYGSLNMEL